MSSFPSGHASSAFAGLGFLAWFFYGLYRPHPRRAEQVVDIDVLPRVNGCPRPHSQIIYAFLAFASVVCAFFIAVSRTRDYWYSCPDAVLFYDEDFLSWFGLLSCVFSGAQAQLFGHFDWSRHRYRLSVRQRQFVQPGFPGSFQAFMFPNNVSFSHVTVLIVLG
jgi:hypothetical protein